MASTAENDTRKEKVVVTGIGLFTPMAATTWRSLAALVHNRSCFSAHPTVLVADDRYGTVLRGATVSRVTTAFDRYGLGAAELACALLAPAIRDCVRGLRMAPSAVVSLHIVNGLCSDGSLFYPLLQKQIPDAFSNATVSHLGGKDQARHSFLEQIIRVAALLNRSDRREHRATIIAGVDSLCFPPILDSLMENDRLLSGSNPEGVIAGEAAGAILLEREQDAQRRGAPIYGRLNSCGSGADPVPRTSCRPSSARGLTDAFHQAVDERDPEATGISMVIGDLNGERQRALEWALVESRILSNVNGTLNLWLPAFTSGDCGSAMGAVQCVAALGALAKGAGGGGDAAVFCTDDGGESRVVCFGPGQFRDRHSLNRWRRQRHGETQRHPEMPNGGLL